MAIPKHNHSTSSIKPKGDCPACDLIFHNEDPRINMSIADLRVNAARFKKVFELGVSPISGTDCLHIYTDNPHEATNYFKEELRANRDYCGSLSIFTPEEDISYEEAITRLKRYLEPGKLVAIRFISQVSENKWDYCYLGIFKDV